MKQLNLTKAAEGLKLSLTKKGIVTPPAVELAFDLDVSGSFDDEHRGGLTQTLLSRLVPWGMVFDPDKKLDVFTFSNTPDHVHYVGDIAEGTHEGYIRDRIIEKVPGYNGGTDYSYVLERNLEHFGWIKPAIEAPAPKPGFLARMLGAKDAPAAPAVVKAKKRSIVLFVTDGDSNNSDKSRNERILAESEARGDEVYFLFIGASNQGADFSFLQKIADRFANTGLVIVRDLEAFVGQSDDELNEALIGDELVAWLKK